MAIKMILSLVTGYLLGSVVAAIIISKLAFGEDVREKGSGNSGATNAARVYGLRFGILTFAIDLLKGVAACFLGRLICGDLGMAFAGAGCILGHCFPLYFGFRGGKGVSVGAAIALMINPLIFAAAISAFLLVAFLTKIVSAGSLAGTVTVGALSLFLARSFPLTLIGVLAALLVIFMHRGNIKRLISGTEKRMTFGDREQKN